MIENNVFAKFEEFIKKLEQELSTTDEKGLVLEQNLNNLIFHFNEMKRQCQTDFRSIKPKSESKFKTLKSCQKIIEFILMNCINDKTIDSFFPILADEQETLTIKLID